MRIAVAALSLALSGLLGAPMEAHHRPELLAVGSANLSDWQTYSNARFGTSIDFPAGHFAPGPAPENGDGLRFSGSDGVSGFIIFGRYNVMKLPMSGLIAEDMASEHYDEITYQKWDKGWYVLSGFSGDNIFYRKVILRPVDETIHTFEITYPKAQKEMYDAVVSRMSQSFLSGPASY